MVDSNIPRFSQAIQAIVLAVAFVIEARWLVPLLGLLLLASVLGGPRWNVFARGYRALNLPAGEAEPAAPPRFAQMIGTAFLAIGSVALFTAAPGTNIYWVLGWGPALVVAVLSAVAATTRFCLGCELYLLMQRARAAH